MQPITNQAEQTIAFQQERLSPYVPFIIRALIKTYALPLVGVFIAYTFLTIMSSTIPSVFGGSIGYAIRLLIFVAVLFMGWRIGENRWHGRTLFEVYARVGKARRSLQHEIDFENPSDTAIHQTMSEYIQSADHFIKTMSAHNIIPEITELD
jgi:hypothetical protein